MRIIKDHHAMKDSLFFLALYQSTGAILPSQVHRTRSLLDGRDHRSVPSAEAETADVPGSDLTQAGAARESLVIKKLLFFHRIQPATPPPGSHLRRLLPPATACRAPSSQPTGDDVRVGDVVVQHPRRLPGGHRAGEPLGPPHRRRLQQPMPVREPRRHQDAPHRHRVRALPPER
jgi:hypothetical protein